MSNNPIDKLKTLLDSLELHHRELLKDVIFGEATALATWDQVRELLADLDDERRELRHGLDDANSLLRIRAWNDPSRSARKCVRCGAFFVGELMGACRGGGGTCTAYDPGARS